MHRVNTLIDNCSHLVLIDEDVASRLRLRHYTLHKNIPVDVALKDGTKPNYIKRMGPFEIVRS
jgi:hypothetical protein